MATSASLILCSGARTAAAHPRQPGNAALSWQTTDLGFSPTYTQKQVIYIFVKCSFCGKLDHPAFGASIMDLSLKGRVAVITGASKGVGKGVARAMAAEGVDIALIARGREALAEAADEIANTFGVKVLPVEADVTDTASMRKAAEAVRGHFGKAHILVNNAGAAIRRQDREIMWDDSDWLNQVQIKSVGALRMIREFLPLVPRDGSGRIINIAGASGTMAWMPALTYGLNNAALIHVTGYLAADLANDKITVNAIVPGLVGTEWREDWAAAAAEQAGKAKAEWLSDFCRSKGILSGRWGNVEEIGDLAAFIASDKARYINGAKLAIDGGLTVNAR
ncbi:SDR family NAD(P)-dependent oxidoreductase [Cupriavidus sp. TMH.W2]|uniref:SDR family NAD(P)-dependent oxidoreductase n=1 Tax=Cupriavidus sp. TMH.W2 TaxID=3434465 RepID=UPI003D7731AD